MAGLSSEGAAKGAAA